MPLSASRIELSRCATARTVRPPAEPAFTIISSKDFSERAATKECRSHVGLPLGCLIADHVDPCKSAHHRCLDQPILHRWIAEVVPLLQKIDAQHGCQRIGRTITVGADLGIVGLDQINQCFPRHNIFHLAQKSFSAGALFGSGLLVITESELLAAHEPCPYLRLLGYFRADGSGFPEPP